MLVVDNEFSAHLLLIYPRVPADKALMGSSEDLEHLLSACHHCRVHTLTPASRKRSALNLLQDDRKMGAGGWRHTEEACCEPF